jgi:purine-cytosine permease-like protein
VRRTLGTALAGLALGAVAVPLALSAFAPLGFLVLAALVALAALRRESRAFGGGLLIAFGLWWVYFISGAADRCDLLNRQPAASCAIYGTNEQLVLAGCVAFVGGLLVVIALRGRSAKA